MPDLERLPENRDERFWSATVLPALIAGDNFGELEPFLELVRTACGDERAVPPLNARAVRFETEYSLRKATRGDPLVPGDTPDILIVDHAQSGMYCVEVKMFDAFTASGLRLQIERQKEVLKIINERYGPFKRQYHVALIPEGRKTLIRGADVPYVTWEAVLEQYKESSATYFVMRLQDALLNWEKLKSKRDRRDVQYMTGEELCDVHDSVETKPCWVGRNGGLDGKLFKADIENRDWSVQRYEVDFERDGPKNRNWFPYEDFYRRCME